MKFIYKINLEVDFEFDAPLLGTDTTGYRRKIIDRLSKEAFKELMNNKESTTDFEETYDETNMKGKIKCSKKLRGDVK